MSRRLVVITAGLSQPSSTRLLADRIADAVGSQVSARGESLEVEVVELRELAHDLATTMTTGGMPTPAVSRARDLVSSADGVVAVSPVFTASYSGLFKMFVDVLDTDALDGMPVVVAATAGSERHQLVLDHAMRPLFTYLRAVVVPTGVFAATSDFGAEGADGEGAGGLGRRIARASAELAALMVAEQGAVAGFVQDVAPARRRTSGTAVEQEVTPFEDLLRGVGQ